MGGVRPTAPHGGCAMKKSIRPLFIWLARLAIGGLFLGACIPKIMNPEAFALIVYRYRILPDIFVNLMALYLPWVEGAAALAVVFGPPRWRAAGAAVILAMLVVFTLAISLNVVRGIEISCGCFSTRADAAVSDGWNLLRNIAALWLSMAVFVDAEKRLTTPTREAP